MYTRGKMVLNDWSTACFIAWEAGEPYNDVEKRGKRAAKENQPQTHEKSVLYAPTIALLTVFTRSTSSERRAFRFLTLVAKSVNSGGTSLPSLPPTRCINEVLSIPNFFAVEFHSRFFVSFCLRCVRAAMMDVYAMQAQTRLILCLDCPLLFSLIANPEGLRMATWQDSSHTKYLWISTNFPKIGTSYKFVSTKNLYSGSIDKRFHFWRSLARGPGHQVLIVSLKLDILI